MKNISEYVNLIILPSLRATILANGDIVVTEKFLDGVTRYKQLWSGPVSCLLQGGAENYVSKAEKNIIFNPNKYPFTLEIISYADLTPAKLKAQSSVVLASVKYELNHISQVCKSANIPCIIVSEYSYNTRKQIINIQTQNPVKKLRRQVWEYFQEQKQKKTITLSHGIQCNGIPAYNAYKNINTHPLLYFDNRINHYMLATEEDIERRYAKRKDNIPIRLVFSGRLTQIKGADHLLHIAEELKKIGINFVLYICGDGELRQTIESKIAINQLDDCVKIMGYLDFKTELIPFIKNNIDLFICCHRQGDPSCTYIETMSCGVPIIGYANEAFEGLVAYSRIGWVTPMDKPKLLAMKIAEIVQKPEQIKQMSLKSLEFAQLHSFEKTFKNRIDHIKSIASNFYCDTKT